MGKSDLQIRLQAQHPPVVAVPAVHVLNILLQRLVPSFRFLRLEGHGAEHTHGADHIGIPADLLLGQQIVVVPHFVIGSSARMEPGILRQGVHDVLPAVRLLVVIEGVVIVLLEGVPAPSGQVNRADTLLRVLDQKLLTQVRDQESLIRDSPDFSLALDQSGGVPQNFQCGQDILVPGEHLR